MDEVDRPFITVHPFLFETAWGWCGAGVSAQGAVFLRLPVGDLEAALKALEERMRREGGDSVYLPAVALFPDGRPAGKEPVPGGDASRDLVRQVRGYFEGRVRSFDLPLASPEKTAFRRRVRAATQRIPYGETLSYGDLAALAGSPGAARAVGQCMAKNPTPLLVPCHRVVGAGGALGGFSAETGVALKQRLLEWERKNIQQETTTENTENIKSFQEKHSP